MKTGKILLNCKNIILIHVHCPFPSRKNETGMDGKLEQGDDSQLFSQESTIDPHTAPKNLIWVIPLMMVTIPPRFLNVTLVLAKFMVGNNTVSGNDTWSVNSTYSTSYYEPNMYSSPWEGYGICSAMLASTIILYILTMVLVYFIAKVYYII